MKPISLRLFGSLLAVAGITGSLVAFFLWSLDKVTQFRWHHSWLLFLLPLGGLLIYYLYQKFDPEAEKGNNLIIDEIHHSPNELKPSITPLILFSTLITHLFGGSAGREGTAVQMGGGISKWFIDRISFTEEEKKLLFLCGMSAGFAAIFNTPVTGAVFAIEVLAIGSLHREGFLPCLLAAFVGKLVTNAFPISHTHYSIHLTKPSLFSSLLHLNLKLLGYALIAGVLFGLVAKLFVLILENIKKYSQKTFSKKYQAIIFGGLIIIALGQINSIQPYLGLGVSNLNPKDPSLVNAFNSSINTPHSAWFLKLMLTAITLGFGYKGGEVTPLFFIGATFGNAFAGTFGLPIDLFAGLGFIAVFSGATNTPIACTLMGIELFGWEYGLYYAIACLFAYYVSGQKGIYHAQKTPQPKGSRTKNLLSLEKR